MKTNLAIIVRLVLLAGIVLSVNQIFAADSATNSASGTNEPSPFKIIVTPRKTRVHVGERFKVGLEVKNVSNINQTFKVWSCSWYENWKSSNPDVYLSGWACTANWVYDVKLAPGESFKETLNGKEMETYVSQSVTTNKITFRMGFIPSTWGEIHIYDPSSKSVHTSQRWVENPKNTYWSDEVTISINPKSVPDWIPW